MDIARLKLSPSASIKEALEIVGLERVRMAIIVDSRDKFLGILSDSNIRKALAAGVSLQSPIKNIYTKNPITIKENTSRAEILKLSSKWDIYDFPVLNERGQILHILSISSLLSRLPNHVVIMAGGLGSRLKELTKDTPKPMLKVGKKPILESITQRLSAQNFENFIFCVNYKRQVIEDYFRDGRDFGLKISYIKERKKLGTAGALSLIKQPFKHSFVVMNGDILTELDFNALLKAHQKSKALMSVCVREFSYQIPYGVITQKRGFITHIEEKPSQKFLVSAGIYVCEPQILGLLEKNAPLDMPQLIERAMQAGRVNSFLLEDYWIDIGRFEEFKRANDEFKE